MLEDILVPIAVFAMTFGIVFIIFTARNRERMAMIEKGVNPQDFMKKSKPSVYSLLKWALLLVGLGFGLFIGSLLETYTQLPEEQAYFAATLFFGGLGLLTAFMISKKATNKE